jgi:hypothetical protein
MTYNLSDWKNTCTLHPGQKGTLAPYEKYGDQLICVRYRKKGDMIIKTVELVESVSKRK